MNQDLGIIFQSANSEKLSGSSVFRVLTPSELQKGSLIVTSNIYFGKYDELSSPATINGIFFFFFHCLNLYNLSAYSTSLQNVSSWEITHFLSLRKSRVCFNKFEMDKLEKMKLLVRLTCCCCTLRQ